MTINLDNIEVFRKLTLEELEKIKPQIIQQSYAAGEIVLSHGEESTYCYFILEGSVRATTYSVSGKEICFQHLEVGDMFGEISAIDSLPRTVSVIAQADSVLGVIDSKTLWKLMEDYPTVMAGVLKRLTTLVRFLCSRVYEYGALGTRERTRAELLRMARNHMVSDKNAVIEHMPTHEDIANRIASHREAVTKELSYLAKSGLIEKKGKTLVIPDIHALSATLVDGVL